MQGVIKAYDPASGDGVIMCDSDLADYELAPGALQVALAVGGGLVGDLD